MVNQEHLSKLKRGIHIWNQWRNEHRDIQPYFTSVNLSHADLRDADLRGADFSHAKLIGTNLSRANLNGANLSYADLNSAKLIGTNLSYTNLIGIDLRDADLIGTDLSGAVLNNADLIGTDLSDAVLSGATLWDTVLSDVDLRNTKGLLEIRHDGPSRIELYSVQLPQDGSALHFLRGAGVPDEWIDFYQTTMQQPIQYYSLFISYSSKDEAFARRLHADLQSYNVRCWFAPHDMKIGDRIRDRIDDSIRIYEKLLIILSEDSLASDWVEDEVDAALEKERTTREQGKKHTVLFPIRLDDAVKTTTEAWAAKFRRQRHIGNFCDWKDHDAYQKAFERLLRDLKADS